MELHGGGREQRRGIDGERGSERRDERAVEGNEGAGKRERGYERDWERDR